MRGKQNQRELSCETTSTAHAFLRTAVTPFAIRNLRFLALGFFIAATVFLTAGAGFAQAQTKSLKLYFLHTGEKAEIVFKRNGRFDQAGLKKINWFLRDWRRNEPTKMDPNLLDLVWEAYRQTGSNKYIHVISAYRSSASNEMLRKRGRGVAKTSQHTLGRALDFFIPGVKLSKLREIGLKLGVGGVGYYPKSGSPFVHFDTGRVRHWPRMSRRELARVFPDGKTMHVPTDGKPLARYEAAVAEYKRKSATGNLIPNARSGNGGGLNFFQRLAQQAREDEADDEDSVKTPAPRQVATTRQQAPKPAEPAQPDEPAAPQFAALPTRVPVPILAPRGVTTSDGVPIAPAIATEQPVNEAQPETPVDAAPDAIADDVPAIEPGTEDGAIALASAVIPVPARRPQIEIDRDQGPAIAALDQAIENALAEEAPAEGQLAMLPPQQAPSRIAQAASGNELTPDEIEELRRVVRQQIDDTATVVVRAPVPAAAVGNAPATAQNTQNGSPSELQVASIPLAQPSGDTAIMVRPEPSPRAPGADATARQAQTAQRLAELERRRAADKAAQDSVVETETPRIQLASLPVPKPAPRVATQSASSGIPLDAANTQITARPVSLDALTAPQDNTSTIGKWALAADTTIEQLADVQPPAYGRNLIRVTGNPAIAQSFALQPFGPGRNSFNGKAVRDLRNNRGS